MRVTLQNGLLKRECLTLGKYNLKKPTLSILIVNLMPNRLQTEKQLTKLLTQLSVNVNVTFAVPATHHIKHDVDLVKASYVTLNDVWHKNYDGLIVTGAPVDRVKFEDIDYWQEFQKLLAWRKTHVKESLLTCWAAFGAGYAERNFPVRSHKNKIFGVYQIKHILKQHSQLTTGLTAVTMPHSRYFTIPFQGVSRRLKIAGNDEFGAFILRDEHLQSTYITGHLEYDTSTLQDEYQRDLKIDTATRQPENYYFEGKPQNSWQTSAETIFSNWGALLATRYESTKTVDQITTIDNLYEEGKTL